MLWQSEIVFEFVEVFVELEVLVAGSLAVWNCKVKRVHCFVYLWKCLWNWLLAVWRCCLWNCKVTENVWYVLRVIKIYVNLQDILKIISNKDFVKSLKIVKSGSLAVWRCCILWKCLWNCTLLSEFLWRCWCIVVVTKWNLTLQQGKIKRCMILV